MSARTDSPGCVRCGYDLSGVIESWRDSCPIRGTCSECGLELDWVDVLRPERIAPKWSVEHARFRRLPSALVQTVVGALRPRFWRRMPLAAPIRSLRLCVLAVLVLGLAHCAAAGALAYFAVGYCQVTTWTPAGPIIATDWWKLAQVAAQPYVQTDYGKLWISVPPWASLLAIWGLLAPLPYVLLVDTMSQARARSGHLWRGWACFVPTIALIVVLGVVVQGWIRPQLHIVGFEGWELVGASTIGAVIIWRWWLAFTRDYLRLNAARRVTKVMLFIALLAALTVCLSLDLRVRIAIGGFFL